MSPSTRRSAIRFASLPISTSWFTRSKNFSRSTSTTHAAAFLDVPLRFARPRRARGAQAESRSCAREKLGSNIGCRTCSMRLLDEPVEHGRDAELSHPAAALRNQLPLHRRGLVRPREQLLAELGPVRSQVVGQLLHRHPVDAGTALVLPHPLQRGLKVLAFDTPAPSGPLVPERSFPCVAVGASSLRSTLGASPLPSSGSSSCLDI